MTSKTRGASLFILSSAFLAAAAFASADCWNTPRQDVRQIRRDQAQIGYLKAEQRFDVRHDRFFQAGVIHERILADRAAITADKRDLRCW